MTTESAAAEWLAQQRRPSDATEHVDRLLANNASLRNLLRNLLKGSIMSDPVANAAQLGDAETEWGLTPRQLANQYNPDKSDWGRVSIEKAALELGQQLPSRSRYAETTTPIDTLAGFVLDADGHGYDVWVELGAIVGSATETAQVAKLAAAGDARAQAVQKFAAAVQAKLGLA